MSRAYLRIDPALYERKLEQGYSLAQLAAFLGCLCLADSQTRRGRFRDLPVLRALLGPAARHVPFLLERGDLLVQGRSIYVDGWDEWQEGDWTVADRMGRVRSKRGEAITPKSPGAQRTANWRIRKAVFERDEFTCRYCGIADYEREWLVLDHIEPKGPTTPENLATCCRPCNKKKGNKTPDAAGMPLRPVTRVAIISDASQPSIAESVAIAIAESGAPRQMLRPPGEPRLARHNGQHPNCIVCHPVTA